MKRGSLCGGYHNPLTMPSDGYAFYWGDTYWGSMVTRPGRAPEQRNVLICAVPSDTHDDLWIEVSADSIAAFGSRLKDQGEHVSPGFQLGSYSTQLVATASLRRPTPGTVVTQLTDVLSGTPYTASPVTSDRTHSTRSPVRLDLDVPAKATSVECSFAICHRESLSTAAVVSGTPAFLPYSSSDSSLGVAMWVSGWQ